MALVEVRGLVKAFGGVRAIDGIDFVLHGGEIRALIGPNGSGKTTFLNLLSGLYIPDSGRIRFLDQDITFKQPHERVERGMARTFQMIRLFSGLTALENVLVGLHCRSAPCWPWQMRDNLDRNGKEKARALLASVGLEKRENIRAGLLTHGEKRFLEVARALASDPKLLMLDEPSAGMTYEEITRLLDLLQSLHQCGITILMVEHNMQLVMEFAQFITVFDHGRKIAEGKPAEIQRDPQVINAYLGEE